MPPKHEKSRFLDAKNGWILKVSNIIFVNQNNVSEKGETTQTPIFVQ